MVALRRDRASDEWMTVREAREYLGVTKYKITALLKRRGIQRRPGTLDARTAQVPRAAIEALKAEFDGQHRGEPPHHKKGGNA